MCSLQQVASCLHEATSLLHCCMAVLVTPYVRTCRHTICETVQSAACCILIACTHMSATLLQGSVDHTTCEYQRLIDEAPDTIIPARPFTVHARVYDAGDPLGGNFCPSNSSTPLQPCKKVDPTLLNCWQSVTTSSVSFPPTVPSCTTPTAKAVMMASSVQLL